MSENVEITLNGVNVSGCEYIVNSKTGLECDLLYLTADGRYAHYERCSDNPDCYYKQLQREKQKNRKTLKEIEEIAKAKVYAPSCFDDPDCPKNGGVGFDNGCDEYCPILTIEKILEKIKEMENEQRLKSIHSK